MHDKILKDSKDGFEEIRQSAAKLLSKIEEKHTEYDPLLDTLHSAIEAIAYSALYHKESIDIYKNNL